MLELYKTNKMTTPNSKYSFEQARDLFLTLDNKGGFKDGDHTSSKIKEIKSQILKSDLAALFANKNIQIAATAGCFIGGIIAYYLLMKIAGIFLLLSGISCVVFALLINNHFAKEKKQILEKINNIFETRKEIFTKVALEDVLKKMYGFDLDYEILKQCMDEISSSSEPEGIKGDVIKVLDLIEKYKNKVGDKAFLEQCKSFGEKGNGFLSSMKAKYSGLYKSKLTQKIVSIFKTEQEKIQDSNDKSVSEAMERLYYAIIESNLYFMVKGPGQA